MKRQTLLFCMLVAITLVIGCTPSQQKATTTEPSIIEPEDHPHEESTPEEHPHEETEPTTPLPSTETTQDIQTISMVAKQWEFFPDTVTVKQGTKVKLVISSIDVDHGIAIPEFNVNQRLTAGTTASVEFTADKTGTFDLYCNVKCGSGHKGMRGTLVVEP